MTSLFQQIAKKIVNLDNHPFLINYDVNDPVSPIIKTYFTHFLHSTFLTDTKKNKFYFYMLTYNSIFLNDDIKNEFTILFSKAQKVYNALERFAYIYKYKKASIVVDKDMGLNEISENNKNIMCIFQNNSKYLFNILDLINIINTCLTNAYMFFAEPIHIKNPFNNLAFNKSTLYNIYFYIKFNTNLYPELVFKYFQCNFDLTFFVYNNEALIRSYSIKSYVTNSTSETLYKEIMIMIKRFNRQYNSKENKILIDASFPKNNLIKIMKPYLLLYLNVTYSLIPLIRSQSEIELTYKLIKFQKFNPIFGKKIAILKYKNINIHNFNKSLLVTDYDFNDKHIPFNQIDDFTTSHLSVDFTKLYYNANIIGPNNNVNYRDNAYDDDDTDSDEYNGGDSDSDDVVDYNDLTEDGDDDVNIIINESQNVVNNTLNPSENIDEDEEQDTDEYGNNDIDSVS